jgi:hypothetical protein
VAGEVLAVSKFLAQFCQQSWRNSSVGWSLDQDYPAVSCVKTSHARSQLLDRGPILTTMTVYPAVSKAVGRSSKPPQ